MNLLFWADEYAVCGGECAGVLMLFFIVVLDASGDPFDGITRVF